ncbi:MAG: hypothetical protein JNL67_06915 [Planctomycetaceae bacterium]|nr:hypothetical protein [Planctomycetaceae bacterium]
MAVTSNRADRCRTTMCFLAIAAALLIQTSACHRSYYRRQADTDATKLITEKANDPHWALPDRSIEVDPRSRMAHPFSADHPPMPPDDPASHEFMQRVDNKPAYPHWGANGELDQVENPEWLSFVPLNEKGELVLDINRAVQVAYLHSPSYQQQRETLYQSALDVSLERFAFDAQLFASYNSFATADGRIRGGGNSRTSLEASTGSQGVRMRKLGITGSTMVVGLANTMLWQFAGPTTNSTNSLVNVSLIQPLLRGGGRERILEALTFAERNLLANVRQMERFRGGFYLSIVTGRSPGQGPNRGGSFLGAPSGQGTGVGGVLGLLEDRQNIYIQEYNVTQLRNALERFRFLQGAQRINALQVTQVETQLYSAQQQLFRATTNYEASLDQFKITLGLPPETKIAIDDPLLDQFELIETEAIRLQDRMTKLREEISLPIGALNDIVISRPLNADGQPLGDNDEPVAFAWGEDVTALVQQLPGVVEKIEAVRQEVLGAQLQSVKEDVERLRAGRESRIRNLAKLQELNLGYGLLDDQENAILSDDLIGAQAVEDPDAMLAAIELVVQSLERRPREELELVRQNITQLLAQHDNSPATRALLKEGILEKLPQALADVAGYSLELLLIQVVARTDMVELPEIRLNPEIAVKIAQHFRHDWMNARASLVDAWRLIEFQADQLESSFDLVFEGDVGTVGDNPLDFRTANGRARAGFRFDSPITRLEERNNYRAALIRYQQARRQYYQFRDEVARNLRQILRLVELNKVLFELNRLQIKVNAVNVEQANFEVSRPSAPGARGGNPTIGRDLTDAINRLQQSQSAFLSTWVDYEVLRRGLDFDLGTMQLDENSLWIDPGPINADYVNRLIERDQELLEQLGASEWFGSDEEFRNSTGLDAQDPLSAIVPSGTAPTTPSEPDSELEKLREQLRSELKNAATRIATSPKPEADASASRVRGTENLGTYGGLPQSIVAPSNETNTVASPNATTSKSSDNSVRKLPPVDVTAAFPALPRVQDALPSPQSTNPLPARPVSKSTNNGSSNPRFVPVLPQ